LFKKYAVNAYAIIVGLVLVLILPFDAIAQTGSQIFTSNKECQAQIKITARGQECVKNFELTDKKSGEAIGTFPSRKECKAQKVRGQKCVKVFELAGSASEAVDDRRDAREDVRDDRRDAREDVRDDRRDAREDVRRDDRRDVREERREAVEERREDRREERQQKGRKVVGEHRDARDDRRDAGDTRDTRE